MPWTKGKRKGKNKGQGKSATKGKTKSGLNPLDRMTGQPMRCLNCGAQDHLVAVCPARSTAKGTGKGINMVEREKNEKGIYLIEHEECALTIDNGAAGNVVGPNGSRRS